MDLLESPDIISSSFCWFLDLCTASPKCNHLVEESTTFGKQIFINTDPIGYSIHLGLCRIRYYYVYFACPQLTGPNHYQNHRQTWENSNFQTASTPSPATQLRLLYCMEKRTWATLKTTAWRIRPICHLSVRMQLRWPKRFETGTKRNSLICHPNKKMHRHWLCLFAVWDWIIHGSTGVVTLCELRVV